MNRLLPEGPERANERTNQILKSAILLRIVLVAICFVSCNGVGQSGLQFGSAQPRYTFIPTSGASLKAQASPTLIFAGSPTRITVQVQLLNTKAHVASLALYRMASGTNQPIAELYSQGDGNLYSGDVILDESRVGAVVLEVAANVSAVEWTTPATNATTLLSNAVTINVMAQHEPENQGGQVPLTTISGRSSPRSTWGASASAMAAVGAMSTTLWLFVWLRRPKPTATPQLRQAA